MTKQFFFFLIVILVILAVTIPLAISTFYINFWPTDSQSPYIPVAARLFSFDYISDIHELNLPGILRVNMRAKEALIFSIAVMQKILNDTSSLYPNILLLIVAFGLSALMVYLIVRHFFDAKTALVTFLFFVGCQWTYLYILQGAHQPLALMNFLAAVYFLTLTSKHRFFYFLSGGFLAVMFFSSPTAILFGPYYLGVLIYNEWSRLKEIKSLLMKGLILLSGMILGYLFFTLPHPIQFIGKYIEYINWSRYGNNFTIYRQYLPQFFALPVNFRGAGLSWIIKYAFFIMPVLFPLYLLSLTYIFKLSLERPKYIAVILLSLSTPILVEFIQVVQFGRNYFTWIVGIIGVLPFAIHQIPRQKFCRVLTSCLYCLLAGHILVNSYIFLTDIFPGRMSTANVYQWCQKNNIDTLYIYADHPMENNTTTFLNNPKHEKRIQFKRFRTIKDVSSGYVMLPPLNGKTIFVECRKDHFLFDPYLTELFFSGKFEQFVVKKFKTMANSRYWNMEEEICAHRDLTLGQVSDDDRDKGFTYIVDAQKLQNEWFGQN